MVPLDATATPTRLYRAVCTKEIYWAGQTHRQGDTISIVSDDVETLRAAGVIGDIKRVDVETAVNEAPEDASRNYRRRGR
jgi:hypothetical protein